MGTILSLQERLQAFIATELDTYEKFEACCNCDGSWQKFIVVPNDTEADIFISDWISPTTSFRHADTIYSFPSQQDLVNWDLSEWGMEDEEAYDILRFRLEIPDMKKYDEIEDLKEYLEGLDYSYYERFEAIKSSVEIPNYLQHCFEELESDINEAISQIEEDE